MPEKWKIIGWDSLSSLLVALYFYLVKASLFQLLPLFILSANVLLFAMLIFSSLRELRIHYILGKSKKRQWQTYIGTSALVHLSLLLCLELVFALIRSRLNLLVVGYNLLFALIAILCKAVFLQQFLRRNL